MYREQGFSGYRYLYGFLRRNDAHRGGRDAPSMLSIRPGLLENRNQYPYVGFLFHCYSDPLTAVRSGYASFLDIAKAKLRSLICCNRTMALLLRRVRVDEQQFRLLGCGDLLKKYLIWRRSAGSISRSDAIPEVFHCHLVHPVPFLRYGVMLVAQR